VLLLSEAFRHAKALGAWGEHSATLETAGIPQDTAGVVAAGTAGELVPQIAELLANHRVWERFPAN
jgi:catalase